MTRFDLGPWVEIVSVKQNILPVNANWPPRLQAAAALRTE
jgi:hypothetical protein